MFGTNTEMAEMGLSLLYSVSRDLRLEKSTYFYSYSISITSLMIDFSIMKWKSLMEFKIVSYTK